MAQVKVLIVEDDPEWLGDHEKNLRQQGIEEIITATDAETAIRLINKEKPTGIVTDGLYGRWTEIGDEGQKLGIPVILISAAESEAEEQGCKMSAELRKAHFINKYDIDLSEIGAGEFYGNLAQELRGVTRGGKEALAE